MWNYFSHKDLFYFSFAKAHESLSNPFCVDNVQVNHAKQHGHNKHEHRISKSPLEGDTSVKLKL